MSLKSQQKAVPSCLYKNVCFTKRNPGLLRGGFHNKMVSILSFFFLFFFAKKKIISVAFSQAGLVDGFSFIHALLCLHRWQRSTPGVSVFHSQQISLLYRGDFLFVQGNHTQRNANVQIRVERYKNQASRYCSAVDLEIWVLTFLPVCLDKSRDFPQQL